MKWLWKFGLALTKRRLLRSQPHSMGMIANKEAYEDTEDVLWMYMEINDHVADKSFRARVYAEIALVLHNAWKTKDIRNSFQNICGLSPEEACEIALRLDMTVMIIQYYVNVVDFTDT